MRTLPVRAFVSKIRKLKMKNMNPGYGNSSDLTELEKRMNGEYYDCHSPVFTAFKARARKLLTQYNTLPCDDKTERYKLLKELFGIALHPSIKSTVFAFVIFIKSAVPIFICKPRCPALTKTDSCNRHVLWIYAGKCFFIPTGEHPPRT
jgi:hypothetical protein